MTTRYHRKSCSGQALVEFVLLVTVMIICCIEIYQLIEWSGDGIKTQAASWFVARAEAFDFKNNNTGESDVLSMLEQAVFTNHQDFTVDLHESIGNNIPEASLYVFDVLAILSADISLVRQGTVTVYTHDYFESLPSVVNLPDRVTVLRKGHHFFKSQASSMVFASWTSAAKDHNFHTSDANNYWNTHNSGNSIRQQIAEEKAKLEQEADQWDVKAAADYQAWETEKDATKKQKDWQAYEQATEEAAQLRDQAAQLVDPTSSGD